MKNLFNKDGTLSRISFCPPSGNRGEILQIRLGDKGRNVKSLSLVGRDFATVYNMAVDMLAADAQITDVDIVAKMHKTSVAFLSKYELVLVPVSYLQAKQQKLEK